MCLVGRPNIGQTPVTRPWFLRAIASQAAIAPAEVWISAGKGRIPGSSARAFTCVRDIVDIYLTNEEQVPKVTLAPQDANLPNIAVGAAATL